MLNWVYRASEGRSGLGHHNALTAKTGLTRPIESTCSPEIARVMLPIEQGTRHMTQHTHHACVHCPTYLHQQYLLRRDSTATFFPKLLPLNDDRSRAQLSAARLRSCSSGPSTKSGTSRTPAGPETWCAWWGRYYSGAKHHRRSMEVSSWVCCDLRHLI